MGSVESFIEGVDARTKLAGSNEMEILLFSLGTSELFGINVFKVREVMYTPELTGVPNPKPGISGMVSLRGHVIPVIRLGHLLPMAGAPDDSGRTMIVTEFNRQTQGFLVHAVDRIIRKSWSEVKPPTSMLANAAITAITDHEGRLVSILDLEKVLTEVGGYEPDFNIPTENIMQCGTAFVADDSLTARSQLDMVLKGMGMNCIAANSGTEAWSMLQSMAQGGNVRDRIQIIITDNEMPGMDGFVLTKNIKSDPRFSGIPVIMHSSMSAESNKALGASVGVDMYVPKLSPQELSSAIKKLIGEEPQMRLAA